jgi:hypothetical protein
MVAISIRCPHDERADVRPVLSPTVPKADTLSKKRSMKSKLGSEKTNMSATKNTRVMARAPITNAL